MIQRVADFTTYFAGIRRRSLRFFQTLPPDKIDWSPQAGEFTCGDIIRHLAAAEQMFVGAVATGRWFYPGHARAAHSTLPEALADLEASHAIATALLAALDDAMLTQPCATLEGPAVPAWRLLLAMVEHEIHHRSQFATYLTLLGVTPPQIYGLGVEDVIARATG
ncbi:MAG: DinB family protein [Chloroflexaceae bacterium]